MCSCFLPCTAVCVVSQSDLGTESAEFFSDSLSSCVGLQTWLDGVATSPNVSTGDEEEIPGAIPSNGVSHFGGNVTLNWLHGIGLKKKTTCQIIFQLMHHGEIKL